MISLYALVENDGGYDWSSTKVVAVSESLDRLNEYKTRLELELEAELIFKQELADIMIGMRAIEPRITDYPDKTDDWFYYLNLWAMCEVAPRFKEVYTKHGREFPVQFDWMQEVNVEVPKNRNYTIDERGIVVV